MDAAAMFEILGRYRGLAQVGMTSTCSSVEQVVLAPRAAVLILLSGVTSTEPETTHAL
jgi:hypothetical protein